MKEIPVLFNGAMVRAILDDRKTQTRRPVKFGSRGAYVILDHGDGAWPWHSDDGESELCNDGMEHPYVSPHGQPGDRLWVRETWDWRDWQSGSDRKVRIAFAADGQQVERIAPPDWNPVLYGGERWHPSIHMPRWAARLFLDVLDVRIERLQDISEEDARAEGADKFPVRIQDQNGRIKTVIYHRLAESCRDAFQRLWISVYGADSWAANPWVWVTTFRRVR